MKTINLIRHARPNFPLNERYCLGHTDMPLGKLGHMQGVLLKEVWQTKSVPVYSSPLKRAKETAEYVKAGDQKITIVKDLQELNAGIWDGYNFSEIKLKWPDLYAKRANAFANELIPQAEKHEIGLDRFKKALLKILEDTSSLESEIVIVAHATVIQLLIADLFSVPKDQIRKYKLPYASWITLKIQNDKNIINEGISVAQPNLTDSLCEELLKMANCSEQIIKHCQKVADLSVQIGKLLTEKGIDINLDILRQSAYLHDIARAEKNHEKVGAEYLEFLGYPDHAKLIADHNTAKSKIKISETSILYLADKMVQNDQIVSLPERFEKSYAKCSTPESKKAHLKRKNYALELYNLINHKLEKRLDCLL